MDDPRENVPDELEERLDNLSATLTDDDVRTERSTGSEWDPTADADADDKDSDDQDADADDADPGDQDTDADDAG
ncbi:MAG: hypothetical protein ACRDN6_13700 [Gaiellaceae bacterium]